MGIIGISWFQVDLPVWTSIGAGAKIFHVGDILISAVFSESRRLHTTAARRIVGFRMLANGRLDEQ